MVVGYHHLRKPPYYIKTQFSDRKRLNLDTTLHIREETNKCGLKNTIFHLPVVQLTIQFRAEGPWSLLKARFETGLKDIGTTLDDIAIYPLVN